MPEPDYFDRLLARQAGAGAGWARPRLPGPFERAEPRWNEVAEPPRAAPPVSYPVPEFVSQPPPWQVRVERHTEIRTETPAPTTAVPEPAPAIHHWISRLISEQLPTARPQPDRADVPRGTATAPAASGAVRPARPAAMRAAGQAGPARAAQAMPSRDQTAELRRSTARPQPPRRRARPAEPAVHVRIGRLEVRATGTDRAPTRTARPGRQTPAVSLTDYLTAGRRP